MLRKLSPKTILEEAGVKDPFKFGEDQSQKFLYGISGVAVGVKTGQSSYGMWTAFTGEFSCVVPGHEDVEIEGVKAFLPEPAQTQLQTALTQAGTEGVEFSLAVFLRAAKAGERSNTGYIFESKWVVQPATSNKIKPLSAKMASFIKEIKPEMLPPAVPKKK